MTLSEELSWRGFVNQSTLDDISQLDMKKFKFYFGIDPSADSMQIGNLASAMMVKHFINHGHQAYLLVGGATGMIGDPDGKSEERQLLTVKQITQNKHNISEQYKRIFAGSNFEIVDNFDWFKGFGYLEFLRDIGKHVPMRQMLGREFVQNRLGENGNGISYAEFSYVLIQAYDFLHLHKQYGVNLQLCGSDQWGNSIAGVDLIRRVTGEIAHVWSAPLIVNPQTGIKFGKSEGGAVWLDSNKTSVTSFYQFWINADDYAVEHYLKIFTFLSFEEIKHLMIQHNENPKLRLAQFKLADEVTKIVHGEHSAKVASLVTSFLLGKMQVSEANGNDLKFLTQEIPSIRVSEGSSIAKALVECGLASSNNEGRKLIASGAIYVNNQRKANDVFNSSDFNNRRLLLRKGKAFKDSALIELR